MCPCHGGVYYADGSRASGPPPRGLYEYEYKVEGGAALGARRRAADALGAGVSLRCAPIGAWLERAAPGSARRSARPPTARRCRAARRAGGTSSAARTLVVLRAPGRDRHLPRDRLRAVGERRLARASSTSTTSSPLGWFLRALHGWGSNFMVALMTRPHGPGLPLRRLQVPARAHLDGRRASCCLLTLGMAFTGQVLRFDQDAYWGLGIGAAIAGRIPFVGPQVVHLLLGGPIIAGATLSRFFALHVFVIPGLLIALVGPPPAAGADGSASTSGRCPGRLVNRETYRARVRGARRTRDGVPFVPDAAKRDLVFAGLVILALVACAAVFGPFGPNGAARSDASSTRRRGRTSSSSGSSRLFALLPRERRDAAHPDRRRSSRSRSCSRCPSSRAPARRAGAAGPVAVIAVILVVLTLGTLTCLGTFAPWSPRDGRLERRCRRRSSYLKGRSPLELQGALLVQGKQCRNCHSLGGEGGLRGPALDDVATRLTRDQLIRQVLQGGGNMPAYGKNLQPAGGHGAGRVPRDAASRRRAAAGARRERAAGLADAEAHVSPARRARCSRSWIVEPVARGRAAARRGDLRARLARPRTRACPSAFRAGASPPSSAGSRRSSSRSRRRSTPSRSLLLQVHMAQHLLLMVVAPPLLLLGAPPLPLLRGLPARLREVAPRTVPRLAGAAAPRRRARRIRSRARRARRGDLGLARAGGLRARAALARLARGRARELPRRGAALLVAGRRSRWPSRPRWPRWAMVPYLLLADLQNTVLAALLVFSDRVLYPSYARCRGSAGSRRSTTRRRRAC